jgi:hypothetical protein
VDKLEVDMEFNVDYIWHEPWVYDRAQIWATTYHAMGTPPMWKESMGQGTDVI